MVVVSNLRRGRKPPGAAGRLGDPPVRHLRPYGGLPDVVAARADGIEDIRFWLLLQNAKEVDPAGGAEGRASGVSRIFAKVCEAFRKKRVIPSFRVLGSSQRVAGARGRPLIKV